MKHFNDDKYIIPWCLDRWKQWLKLRKAYKYWLEFLRKKVTSTTLYTAF